MRSLLYTAILLALSQAAFAQQTETYGWEGTATILSMYPDSCVMASIATDPVHGGSQSLELERLSDGTPQAYVAWITGLSDGEEVTASFWRYDVTPAAAPSCRIWAHWNDDPGDVNGYAGSAGGNSDYGPGTGWDETEYTWTVVDGHTGLVIEARVYSNPGDMVWIDDMTVTAPTGAEIVMPGGLALERQTWGSIKTVF
ncbi:MAG: hypothetical protein AVO35_01635 [Candidatus Aegiribacteria sp. MLS_C]|nr:MAG: hypothetical protein AVO35_01635 [Candidatus Aegiribacteria sp. MLS_C]